MSLWIPRTLVTAALLATAACAGSQPAGTAGASTAAAAPTAAPSGAAPPPSPAATPTPEPPLVAIADFRVVAYQGDAAFGGHEGSLRAVFAAGHPVVLLYFAGL